MKKRVLAVIVCLALVLPMLGSFSGCGGTGARTANLMEGVQANPVEAKTELVGEEAVRLTDFAVHLFRQSMRQGENTLVSPLSVVSALAMAANGAKGETLAQMQRVLGLSPAQLNAYLHTYLQTLLNDEKNKLSLANSIWFTDDESFTANREFLQTNADWYGAGVYKAPFNDATCKAINRWVNAQTDGMVRDILDEIPEDAVMYLVNALAFDAEWQKIYQKQQVRDDVFTREDGTRQKTQLMFSNEYQYLRDTNAMGFLKYYAGQTYAFAALLPDEGVSIADYVAALTGEKLRTVLTGVQPAQVNAAMPKFESGYSVDLREALMRMGMTDAFDDQISDFSGMGASAKGNLVISRVLHKTFISVHEKGTRAGASTAIEVMGESARPQEEVKTVRLDRPFVYILVDCKANIPVFIGTVMDVEQA